MPVGVCARVPLSVSVCVWSEPATATIRGRTTRARTTSPRQESSTNKTAEKRQRKRKSKTEEQITQQTTNEAAIHTHTHSITQQHSTAQHSRPATPPLTHPRPRPLHRLDANVRQRQPRGNHPKTIFGASWTTLRPPCGFMLRRCSNCSRYFCHCCWCCPFMWVDCLPWPSLIFLLPYKHINTLKQTYTYICLYVCMYLSLCVDAARTL